MRRHPVPRNITGFKFKLVGDMTLKQFGYLAVGVVLGYILYKIVPGPGIIKLVFWVFSGGAGAALAFLPFQGRPLDTWLTSFVQSILSPTQYVWKKQNPPPSFLMRSYKKKKSSKGTQKTVSGKDAQSAQNKLDAYLKTLKDKPHEVLDKKEKTALKKTIKTLYDSSMKKSSFQKQKPAEKKTTEIKPELKSKTVSSSLASAWGNSKNKKVKKTKVSVMSKEEAKTSGFPQYPTPPNVLTGVVFDSQGNYLPDVMVNIKDEEGSVIRALKTGRLAQFNSNSPLPSGTYYLEIKDPKGRGEFDIIKVTLHGKMFSPVKITAKPKTVSKREKIKHRLFNQQAV